MMKVKEVRCIPLYNYRLVNMVHDGNEFAYYNDGQLETFEIYYLDNTRTSGFRYSRCYKLSEGQVPPKKYAAELEFLKQEFNKIDWDAKMVEVKLTT